MGVLPKKLHGSCQWFHPRLDKLYDVEIGTGIYT